MDLDFRDGTNYQTFDLPEVQITHLQHSNAKLNNQHRQTFVIAFFRRRCR